MEIHIQYYNESLNLAYETAPTIPHRHTRNSTMELLYYSAPTSPQQKTFLYDENQDTGSGLISDYDFEFETGKKFSFSETIPGFDSQGFYGVNLEHDSKQKHRERADSLSSMAFADELFVNGLVMPLKLPPRLQYDSDYSGVSPVRSPRTACRLPFSRKKSSWNDDFDPFTVALEKVREEKRGRRNGGGTNNHHKRSRSYSPFRYLTKSSNVDSNDQDLPKEENNPEKRTQEPAKKFSEPLDFKDSVYARWVRDQNQRGGLGKKELKSPRMLNFFDKKVRPLKNEQEGLENNISSVKEKHGTKDADKQSKVKKLRDAFLRFALLRRENSRSKRTTKGSEEVNRSSYFSRLGFKLK